MSQLRTTKCVLPVKHLLHIVSSIDRFNSTQQVGRAQPEYNCIVLIQP